MPHPRTPAAQAAIALALNDYLADWNAAGRAWDSDALAACFTEDACFFGGRPEHYIGREAIRQYFLSYVGLIASVALSLRDQQVVALPDGAVLTQGFGDFSFVLGDGQKTQSVVRTTLHLVRDGDRWRARMQQFTPPPRVPPLGRDGD